MKKVTLYIYTYARIICLMCVMLSMQIHGQNAESRLNEQVEDSVCIEDVATDSLTGASLPWPLSLQTNLDAILSGSKLLDKSQFGLYVYDLTADSVLYARGAKQTLRPASTMKILTAVTALDKLGETYQYKTRLRYTGDKIDSTRTLVGDLYLVGGMDPRFNRDDMITFVETLRTMGIDTIRGNIYADRSMKDKDLLGEGWCWDDDNPVLSPLVYGRKDQFVESFVKELESRHIRFIGHVGEKTAPSSSKLICSQTHSITQILSKMMKDSDNLYAESMFYQIALANGKPAKASGARSVEQALIRKMHLSPSDYKIADGSGLSLYNYVTAELEVAFLRYAFANESIYKPLYFSLPIAGVDGTLAKRMKGTKAERNVRAKTGTLTGISSLAGYAKASNGHNIAFCIINQGVLSVSSAKALQDRICVALTR